MTDTPTLPLADYPHQTYDKLRYGDTDRQGHVNNAVFATLFETGRVDSLMRPDDTVLENGQSFVIAQINMHYLAEIHWPGTVEIGTRITGLGTSSIKLEQGLYQDGARVAEATSVVVIVSNATKRGTPLNTRQRDLLSKYLG